MFLKDAAEYVGIARSSVYNWIERGELEENRLDLGEEATPSEEKYVEFLDTIRRSQAFANITDMNVIGQAAKDDPVWAEKRLKLRNPDLFRQKIGVEVRRGPSAQEIERRRRLDILDRASAVLDAQ